MSEIPYGYCHCGCGLKTTLSKQTVTVRGSVKGEPNLFITGHHSRKYPTSFVESGGGSGTHKSRSTTRTYRIWYKMHHRCENTNDASYCRYGAKGISVCERWSSFEAFLSDIGNIPPDKSIDRIDNNKGYTPENCRLATALEQARNRKRVHMHTSDGVSMYAPDWAIRLNVKYRTLAYWLQRHTMQEISDLLKSGSLPKIRLSTKKAVDCG